MKNLRYAVIIVFVAVLVSCKAKNQIAKQVSEPTEQMLVEQDEDVITGPTKRNTLETEKFGMWFNSGYENYGVDTSFIHELKTLLVDVDITIFMGTWCEDSKRETPHFYKILDVVNKTEAINLITVNRERKTPEGLENGQNIIRVPTFIFSKDGKELGRIVEYPIESLEQDMLKILKGEAYEHAYSE